MPRPLIGLCNHDFDGIRRCAEDPADFGRLC
jgi:hypothetical protein